MLLYVGLYAVLGVEVLLSDLRTKESPCHAKVLTI